MPTHTGAEALLEQVLANDVDTIFGLPGGQLDPFFDAMYRAGNRLKYVGARHEQGAGYMAFGYARSTGRVGTYAVVPGPGVLNTTAALSSAYAVNAPVLCLTGQIPSWAIGRGIGMLHEIPDQLAVLRGLTRWSERVDSAGAAPALVNEAFARLRSGRRGPHALEMACDVMAGSGEVSFLPKAVPHANPIVDVDAVARAVSLIRAAERPMIFVGSGAADAANEVRELAERLDAPVVCFRGGQGVLDARHELSHSLPGGHILWHTADLVIGIGSRMEQPLLSWGLAPDMQLIRIDIDAEEMNRVATPTVGIHADARDALLEMNAQLGRSGHTPRSRRHEMQALKAEVAQRISGVEPQLSFIKAIRSALPEDGYFVDEITQVGYCGWYAFPTYSPRHHVNCGYQGTLGYGYATALGVKVAHPDKAVVNITGDGGFLFTANELATAAQNGIALVTVLFNNRKFQNVQRQQDDWFGGRHIGSDLSNPDFQMFAQSFGVMASRVKTPVELEAEIRRALAANRPWLIEVEVGDMPTPWKHVLMPKVERG